MRQGGHGTLLRAGKRTRGDSQTQYLFRREPLCAEGCEGTQKRIARAGSIGDSHAGRRSINHNAIRPRPKGAGGTGGDDHFAHCLGSERKGQGGGFGFPLRPSCRSFSLRPICWC